MACFTHLLNLLGQWFEFVTTLFIVVTVTKAEGATEKYVLLQGKM